jgi:hypothetical protein
MANIVALVCVRSPFEYQFLLLPVDVAEAAAQINLGYAYRTKKPNGDAKKPSKVWFTLYPVHARTQIAQDGQQREQEMLRPFLVDRSRAENPELREQQKTRISELLSKVFVPSKSNETDLGRG